MVIHSQNVHTFVQSSPIIMMIIIINKNLVHGNSCNTTKLAAFFWIGVWKKFMFASLILRNKKISLNFKMYDRVWICWRWFNHNQFLCDSQILGWSHNLVTCHRSRCSTRWVINGFANRVIQFFSHVLRLFYEATNMEILQITHRDDAWSFYFWMVNTLGIYVAIHDVQLIRDFNHEFIG